MPLNVFNSPEEMEESEPVFFDGLGLVSINIRATFEYDVSKFDDVKISKRSKGVKESFNRLYMDK